MFLVSPCLCLCPNNLLKPGVKSRMKMQLEQCRQALSDQLSDQYFYCQLGALYIRGLTACRCSHDHMLRVKLFLRLTLSEVTLLSLSSDVCLHDAISVRHYKWQPWVISMPLWMSLLLYRWRNYMNYVKILRQILVAVASRTTSAYWYSLREYSTRQSYRAKNPLPREVCELVW